MTHSQAKLRQAKLKFVQRADQVTKQLGETSERYDNLRQILDSKRLSEPLNRFRVDTQANMASNNLFVIKSMSDSARRNIQKQHHTLEQLLAEHARWSAKLQMPRDHVLQIYAHAAVQSDLRQTKPHALPYFIKGDTQTNMSARAHARTAEVQEETQLRWHTHQFLMNI